MYMHLLQAHNYTVKVLRNFIREKDNIKIV